MTLKRIRDFIDPRVKPQRKPHIRQPSADEARIKRELAYQDRLKRGSGQRRSLRR